MYVTVEVSYSGVPQFSKQFYNLSVNEDKPALTVLATINSDPPGTYSLTSGSKGMFEINTKTGVIRTTSRPLDREVDEVYQFRLIAMTSNRLMSSVHVTIWVNDANDNKPLFWKTFYQVFNLFI